jgi:DNA-directed RNA polymerase specialized sigma24 family protein
MSQGAVLSPAEVREAISRLSDAAWLRLRKVAHALARHRRLEPEDLLQEAFTRALEGSRQCPRNVEVVRFLAEAMRSIASDALKARRRSPEGHAADGDDEARETLEDVPDSGPTAEERLSSAQETAQRRRAVLGLFADDATAQLMVEGVMLGMEGEELRELVGLTPTDFASKRRLVRRRIDAAYPEGQK